MASLTKLFEEIFCGTPSEKKPPLVRRYNTTLRQDTDFPFGPLNYAMADAGATTMEYLENGEWVQL